MQIKRKIKVLIVDDSILFRETLSRGISSDQGIEVVATASDPYSASEKIVEFNPDVMTLDVEMPRMDGIEFLRRLMPQYPIPVVVVSSVSESVFNALNAGAVDFVTKPSPENFRGLDVLINELIIKIKIASTARVGQSKNNFLHSGRIGTKYRESNEKNTMNSKVVAIGSSTGGTEAVSHVLKQLPGEIPGIVIVQHMPPVFTKMFADRLNNTCLLGVKEARDGDRILPGQVLIAPGDKHMRIKKAGSIYQVECFKGDRVNGHCPSVDVLFESAAREAGRNAIGIILTGMGYDGAKGLLSMRRAGARTIGQDEKSCIVYGMPKVAFDIGAVERQVPLENIAQSVYSFICDK